jgi:hypothetical protein
MRMFNQDNPGFTRRHFVERVSSAICGATLAQGESSVLGSRIGKKANHKFNVSVHDRVYDGHRPKGCTTIEGIAKCLTDSKERMVLHESHFECLSVLRCCDVG